MQGATPTTARCIRRTFDWKCFSSCFSKKAGHESWKHQCWKSLKSYHWTETDMTVFFLLYVKTKLDGRFLCNRNRNPFFHLAHLFPFSITHLLLCLLRQLSPLYLHWGKKHFLGSAVWRYRQHDFQFHCFHTLTTNDTYTHTYMHARTPLLEGPDIFA